MSAAPGPWKYNIPVTRATYFSVVPFGTNSKGGYDQRNVKGAYAPHSGGNS